MTTGLYIGGLVCLGVLVKTSVLKLLTKTAKHCLSALDTLCISYANNTNMQVRVCLYDVAILQHMCKLSCPAEKLTRVCSKLHEPELCRVAVLQCVELLELCLTEG